MPFEKGNKEGKGRPPGAANKATATARDYIQRIIDGEGDKLKSELDKLEGTAYVNAIIRLMEFSVPKLQRVQAEIELKEQPRQVYVLPNGQELVF